MDEETTLNDILLKTLTYLKENNGEEFESTDVFDIKHDDPVYKEINGILARYPFFATLPAMGPLRVAFTIHPDWYSALMLNTPEEFLKNYYEYAMEHNESVKEAKNRQKKQDQILDLKIDDLVNKVIESPKVEGRLFRAEVITAISAVAAVISAIAATKGC
jgi:hypothetical protein